jgi:hypothetical protein
VLDDLGHFDLGCLCGLCRALMSSISLFDGLPITEFDVLPTSASRLL